jgi:lipopolysaccharide transport system permease protein
VNVAEQSISSAAEQTWEIESSHPGPIASLAEVWHYRRLLRFIGARALRKIYRRTLLGWAWLFIIPLFPIALRTLIFGGLLNVGADGVPYLLFLTAGTVVWELFTVSLMWATRGLEMNRGVAEQVYVPGAVLTLGNLAPALLDFALKVGALLLMVLVFWAFQGTLPVSLVNLHWTAAALGLAFLFAVSLSFFTSVWNEAGRDMRLVLGQVLAVWYLMTPVLYPVSAMPESWRRWVALNPMASVVETFKWSLFGVGQHDPRALAVTAGSILLILILGLVYFSRNEAAASDER